MFTPLIVASLVASPGQAPKPATNTLCPVLGGKVTPGKSPKVVVQGREYLLCCAACDKDLLGNPGKYLEKDGTPKNAKGKPAPKGEDHSGHKH